MVEVRVTARTTLPPEAVLAAATDFSPRRPEIWTNLDPERYEVLSLDERSAEVIEGSTDFGGIWARERHDWSRPDVVRSDVLESNVFAQGSWWHLRVEPAAGGGSNVEWISHRVPRGVRGRLLALAMRLGGRRFIEGYLRTTLGSLEAREANSTR
jgi:hypothetical protein